MQLIPSHSPNLNVMPKLEITELRREDEKAWDSYVLKSSTSTFYHQLRSVLIKLFQSLMVEKTHKHRPVYLIAKEEEFLMKSLIFCKKLVSVPFAAPYDGVCEDTNGYRRKNISLAAMKIQIRDDF